jgi:hypothetical protein
MKRSKFAMAEALVLDIPLTGEGKGDGSVNSALEEVALQIVDMGGDEIAVETLRNYRKTAAWVLGVRGDTQKFEWREGSAFDAHRRAAMGGMEYSEFAKTPRTTREVQKMLGQKVSATQPKQAVETMTQTERVDMARALAEAEPDIVTDAVVETPRKAVVDAAEKVRDTTPTAQHKAPSTSTMNLKRLDAVKDVISRNVTFTGLIIDRWTTELEELGHYMKPDDYRTVSGYLDAASEKYTDLIDMLETRAEDKEARV